MTFTKKVTLDDPVEEYANKLDPDDVVEALYYTGTDREVTKLALKISRWYRNLSIADTDEFLAKRRPRQ